MRIQMDIPAVSPEVNTLFENKSYTAIFDVEEMIWEQKLLQHIKKIL